MNCHEQPELLDGYVDRELDLSASLEIERHLQTCPACRRRAENLQTLHEAFKSSNLSYRAPDSLARDLRRKLGAPRRFSFRFWERAGGETPSREDRDWLPTLTAWAVSLVVVAVGAFWAGGIFRTSSTGADVNFEAASAHIRSLMASHLMDVASTDQHTVKPWFDGKLDFAPPVIDLASEGFPLAGGRLEYLQGRPAAALVYHRQKHLINVFVSKEPASETIAGETQSSGYNIISWPQGDLICRAVSDLNPVELGTFVKLWRQRAAIGVAP
jgi:anti-sigma factor RsiW